MSNPPPPGLEVYNDFLKIIPFARNLKLFKLKLNLSLQKKTRKTGLFSSSKSIFIRVPKNASTSLSQFLYPESPDSIPHYSAEFYRELFPRQFQEWLVFAALRNPLDRLVSAFTYYRSYTNVEAERQLMDEKYGFLKTFEDFIYWMNDLECIENEEIMRWHHFRKQADFICDPDGRIIADLLFPVEDMPMAVEFLKGRFNINRKISFSNTSSKLEYGNLPMKVAEDYYRKDTNIWHKTLEKKLYWATDWSE